MVSIAAIFASALVAFIVARITASYTVEAARKQSIDTEKARLRHEIARRALDHYEAILTQLKWFDVFEETDEAVHYYSSAGFLMTVIRLIRAADRAIAVADRDEFNPFVGIILSKYEALLQAAGACSPGERALLDDVFDSQYSFEGTLADLSRALDWAAERRVNTLETADAPDTIREYDEKLADAIKKVRGSGKDG